jgi:hypothetical protein
LTLKDIQELVQEKLVEAEKQTKEEFLFSNIDSIFVD